MKTTDKKIWAISKKINIIRKALGYATKDQDIASEYKTVRRMIQIIEEGRFKNIETGGFSYTATKKGLKIEPKFSFRIRTK